MGHNEVLNNILRKADVEPGCHHVRLVPGPPHCAVCEQVREKMLPSALVEPLELVGSHTRPMVQISGFSWAHQGKKCG